MLRQQKIYLDNSSADTTATNPQPETDNEVKCNQQKPPLTHTYSNLSDKSFNVPEPPYTLRTSLVQLNFVKSSFTVNPCMVSLTSRAIEMPITI